jgi:hypothetical protein
MIESSRKALHFGINFLLAPQVALDPRRFLRFQEALINQQIQFQQSIRNDDSFKFIAPNSEPLEFQVMTAGPQVTQLLIVAPLPNRPLDVFSEQADLIFKAFQSVWNEPRQVIAKDVCIRHLYQSEGAHAFEFLWTQRLKQSTSDLGELGGPVLGGGLRFVMPPTPERQTQIEVKIESFLSDSRMLFVETQWAWLNQPPVAVGQGQQPSELLDEVESFAEGQVVRFIRHGL